MRSLAICRSEKSWLCRTRTWAMIGVALPELIENSVYPRHRSCRGVRTKWIPPLPRAIILVTLITAIFSILACRPCDGKWVEAITVDPISDDSVLVNKWLDPDGQDVNLRSESASGGWPYWDERWIWFCPTSGYASFGDDFADLTESEVETLAVWLQENYEPSAPPITHQEKLLWVGRVYEQRKMNSAFWQRYYFLLSQTFAEKRSRSIEYLRQAAPRMERLIVERPKKLKRIVSILLFGE